jgi:oligopeptide transport system permease protein
MKIRVREKEEASKARVKETSLWKDALYRLMRNRMATTGAVIVIALCIMAIFAPLIAPYAYDEGNFWDNYAKPGKKYWLGADFMGRDLLSRIIYGARVSLSVALMGATVSFVVGIAYGLIAGYAGGKVDNYMMRLVDIGYGVPTLLLIILLMVYFKSTFASIQPGTFVGMLSSIDNALGGMFFIFIGIGLTSWLGMARLARGMTLSLKEKEFIETARAMGASNLRIISHHILPNIIGPCIISQTLTIPTYILYEAFLSFIGLGVNPPTPSWGMMISEGYQGMRSYPHLVLFPALALSITMFAFNFLGDGLRDALDPHTKL